MKQLTFTMQKESTTMQTQPEAGSLADLHQRFHGDAYGLREHYRTLQTQCPVLYDQEARCWQVLRCRDVGSLLTDPGTFASARSGDSSRSPPGSVAGIVGRQFLFLDGPPHQALQEVLRKPLGRMASQLGPFLRATISALLERGQRDGCMDLFGDFAAPRSRLLGTCRPTWAGCSPCTTPSGALLRRGAGGPPTIC